MISILKKKIVIIGSGFSSLSAACYLSNYGHEVHLFEKNKTFGGRARRLIKDKFVFDMGPSWYWMPDIIDSFFNENTLYENKNIYKVIDKLRVKKLIYDKDGAVWFNGTKAGRDSDRSGAAGVARDADTHADMREHSCHKCSMSSASK